MGAGPGGPQAAPPAGAAPQDEPRADARIDGGEVVVDAGPSRDALRSRGYGGDEGGRYVLRPFEALYLLYAGRLTLRRGRARVGFAQLARDLQEGGGDALTRFLVYRDLRSRGYVARDGFGFGSDFLVYDRGHFGSRGARYLVFALREGTQERVGRLQDMVDEISRMGKEPIIAVVERRGEVIYYKVSRIEFPENAARAGAGPGPAAPGRRPSRRPSPTST